MKQAHSPKRWVMTPWLCPYALFDLRLSDVAGPLGQFQALKADKDGTRRLVGVLNKALGRGRIDEQQLNYAFKALWQDLDRRLRKIQQIHQPQEGLTKRERAKAVSEAVSETTVKKLYLDFKDQPAPFATVPSVRKLRKEKVKPVA